MSDWPTSAHEQIIKLRTEIERLQAESDISDGLLADAKAEIEQLRAGLHEVIFKYGERFDSVWDRAEAMYHAANDALAKAREEKK